MNNERPVFWYGLPHGYRQLEIHPTQTHLDDLAQQIRELPDDIRDRADQVFRMYATVVTLMSNRQVQGCALGMHPDDAGGSSLSVLTVSSVEMSGVSPKAVLAKLLETGAGAGPDDGIRPVELPCGTGFLTDTIRTAVAPGATSGGEPAEGTVWQGTVAIPDMLNSTVIMVQLVTSSVGLADEYRNVLLGVARTVTFTDPEAAEGDEEPTPGSAAAAVRSDFG